MILFFIGFMGAGKTTFGKSVAEFLEVPFWDVDAHIVSEQKKSIAEIFDTEGQEAFREIEHQTLRHLINRQEEKKIIATGGGAPCFHNNMDLMNEAGITVYLRPPIEELVRRLIPQKAHRPIIRDIPNEELAGFISQMLGKREEYYLQAQFIYENPDPSPEKFIQSLHKHSQA